MDLAIKVISNVKTGRNDTKLELKEINNQSLPTSKKS